MTGQPLVVAIDGTSGVGKSTVARRLAVALDVPYLETGAMYRALGLKVDQMGVDPANRETVEALASDLDLVLRRNPDGTVEVLLDGRRLGEEARQPRISEITSAISTYLGVRRVMVAHQRSFAESAGAVVEGRDIGTKVFPDTPHKFFLQAPLATRVRRRLKQLEESGQSNLSADELMREVSERDERDSTRAESPLTVNSSYRIVDTGSRSIEEVVQVILEEIRQLLPSG
ncbi:MAG: (d)CMP kinase [Thermoanaerobaculia bacterium]